MKTIQGWSSMCIGLALVFSSAACGDDAPSDERLAELVCELEVSCAEEIGLPIRTLAECRAHFTMALQEMRSIGAACHGSFRDQIDCLGSSDLTCEQLSALEEAEGGVPHPGFPCAREIEASFEACTPRAP